ncbi:hypothetical protein GMA12_02980 [Kocuria sediminis]|uniref:Uncharacterized protein n=1 Tax=Kocuria sediminis TaxID=1038857 RepID=A0A6N8GIN1_9MICC|nr:hypothetical protein [Kocuria sediminis]MUN62117.1 hypothetical protein [Kocuria sediminis]
MLTFAGGMVGGALEGRFGPDVQAAVNQHTRIGEPVVANPFVRPQSGDMWLPNATLKPDDVADLAATEPNGQAVKLAQRGAVLFGDRKMELTLVGNRPDQVRVVDIRPESTCSDFGDGTLFQLVPHGGGVPSTERLFINVEDPNAPAMGFDPDVLNKPGGADGVDLSKGTPYFNNKSITLKRNEQQFLLVELRSETKWCSFDLVMTVEEANGERMEQRVLGEGNEMTIAPDIWWMVEDRLDTTESYMGGELCDRLQAVPRDENGELTAKPCY